MYNPPLPGKSPKSFLPQRACSHGLHLLRLWTRTPNKPSGADLYSLGARSKEEGRAEKQEGKPTKDFQNHLSVVTAGSGANNAPIFLLQNLLLQNHKHVIL